MAVNGDRQEKADPTPDDSGAKRDLLFINYGVENYGLAQWLTFKLLTAGYYVWWDQLRLLGGESYPVEIDQAIKKRTFRMLSVLSRATMNKEHPLKERTSAAAVAKVLEVTDFIIPLRAEGFGADELNWKLSDATWIDFSENWAHGLRRLINKLEKIGAPKDPAAAQNLINAWYSSSTPKSMKPEQIWTNILEVLEVPEVIYRVQALGVATIEWPADWPRVEDGIRHWVFELPPTSSAEMVTTPYRWMDEVPDLTLRLGNKVSDLLRQYAEGHARRRGLIQRDDRSLYFPKGLLDGDTVRFQGFKTNKEKGGVVPGLTRKQVVGERSFGLSNNRRQHLRYHQVVHLGIDLRSLIGGPALRVSTALFLTDLGGAPLSNRTAHAMRRRIARNWWNDEWLNRLLAAVTHLADGKDSVNIARGTTARIVIAGRPARLTAPFGIDEGRLVKEVETLHDDEEEDESEVGA